MKVIVSVLFASLSFNCAAQNNALKKTWASPDHLLYVGTFDNNFVFETLAQKNIVVDYGDGIGKAMFNRFVAAYTIVNDTLKLKNQFNVSEPYATFLFDTLKKNRLVLNPLNISAKQIIEGVAKGTNEQLIFHNIIQDHTDSIKFEKIIFKQVGGYHSDPAVIYEIKKDKTVKLYHEKNTRNFAVNLPKEVLDKLPPERRPLPEGYFTATIPKNMLNQLINLLKISEIDKLPTLGQRNIDIPDYTIEIYYNHKIKHIFTGWFPMAAQPLISYLELLPKKLALIPSRENFDIQFDQK